MQTDAVMIRIGKGIELRQCGELDAARSLFAEIGLDGDAFHRCALAHSMADVRNDLHEELVWDLRALHAADSVTDERARQAGVNRGVSGFRPSLNLNLGEVYRELGDLDRARDHLERGRAAVSALGDDGYGRLVRNGLDRLAARLATPDGFTDSVGAIRMACQGRAWSVGEPVDAGLQVHDQPAHDRRGVAR